MGDWFGQLDRTVHRMDFPLVDLHVTRLSTVGAIAFGLLPSSHFAGPACLNQATESLANFMGRYFDLVVVRRHRPLLESLNPAGNLRSLLKNFAKFFFQFHLFRVHAILLEY